MLRDDQGNTHALRLVLRCLEFLRSLRLDAILSGGGKRAKKGSRPEAAAAPEPISWDKV